MATNSIGSRLPRNTRVQSKKLVTNRRKSGNVTPSFSWAGIAAGGKPAPTRQNEGNKPPVQMTRNSKQQPPRQKWLPRQVLKHSKKSDDNPDDLFAHLMLASKRAGKNKVGNKKGRNQDEKQRQQANSSYREKAPEKDKKTVVIVTKQELEFTQQVVRGEADASSGPIITKRKKKKKHPTRLKKAIFRERKERWLKANPNYAIAEKCCFQGNMYNTVASSLEMDLLTPNLSGDNQMFIKDLEESLYSALQSEYPEDLNDESERIQAGGVYKEMKVGKKNGARVKHFKSPFPKIPNAAYIREYVTQVIDKELDDKVTQFLGILMTLQEKLNKSDPQRAMLRRRLVFGTREVLRAAKGKAAKCVIVATNIDEGKSSGGLDETVQKILGFSRENQIPVVFALRRRTLGKSLGKTVKMSTVAIYNADDASMLFKEILAMAAERRQRWEVLKTLNPRATSYTPAPVVVAAGEQEREPGVLGGNDTRTFDESEGSRSTVFNPSAAEWTPPF